MFADGAYVYEAAFHCEDCARGRFGNFLGTKWAEDREGNPVGGPYPFDTLPLGESCDTCHTPFPCED